MSISELSETSLTVTQLCLSLGMSASQDNLLRYSIKIIPGEEVCSQALGSRSLKLQACRPAAAPVSKEHFHLLSAQAQKALWRQRNLGFLSWIICDNLMAS